MEKQTFFYKLKARDHVGSEDRRDIPNTMYFLKILFKFQIINEWCNISFRGTI